MKKDELDKTLRELAAEPLPTAPLNLTASVLREVRRRKRRVRVPLAESLARLLWLPRAALAVVPAAALMGMSIALLAPAPQTEATAARGLYLEVFSQYSPTLPSTYIVSRL